MDKRYRILWPCLLGFSLAFILLLSLTATVPLVADILLGDIPVSREYPTVASAGLQTEEMRRMVVALGSFWFWTGVTFVGIGLTFSIHKVMRGV